MSKYLVAGLGNPGPKYQGTRHNVGFMALDAFAERHDLAASKRKFDGWFGDFRVLGDRVLLLKPLTMMNRSGKSVRQAAAYNNVEADQIIVIHDDIDLELAQIRVKIGGSAGGHNGLSDIISRTGSSDFIRIRFGIGRPENGSVTNHVLGRFTPEQFQEVEKSMNIVCDTIETIVTKGPQEAQNRFN
jgi:PTH1 family peptidyl-tRNA hydrolase